MYRAALSNRSKANDIITDLSKFHELFVIASTTVFSCKGKTVGIEEVSKELGVRYVPEGSVHKSGDRGRINVQLVDAGAGNPIWTEFPHLALDRAQELAQRGWTVDETNSAVHHLLGMLFALRDQYEPAIDQLERALVLNPNDADTYEALGWSRLWSGQIDAAIESLELAPHLDPSAPRNTLMHLGMAYYLKERYQDAIATLEKAAYSISPILLNKIFRMPDLSS